MKDPSTPSSVDALWEELAPHVEWPEGFSLVFLFAGHPRPVSELRERLEESVRQRGKTLKVLEPGAAEAVEALTPSVVAAPGADCGALWISLLRRAGEAEWKIAVRGLMQRLNERRFLLERDVAVPVVIVLPLELRPEVYVLAPDLWTVRSFAEHVPEPEIDASRGNIDNRGASIGQQIVVSGNATFGGLKLTPSISSDSRGRAEVEWARLLATGELRWLTAADGFAAYRSAYERGDMRAARRIAMQTLAVVLSQVGIEVESVDEFDVAETLARVDFGDTRLQRDFATTLEQLGRAEMAEKHLDTARMLFQRALDLREALAKTDPLDVRAQQEHNVSLQGFGEIEMEAGNLDAARDFFMRAAELADALVRANPHDDRLGSELINSWTKLGELEVRARNLTAARDYFLRTTELAERVARANPHDVKPQIAWSSSLGTLGFVEMLAGNIAAARDYFRRRVEVAESTAFAHPHNARPNRDRAEALTSLSIAEEEAGNFMVARHLLERVLHLGEALAKTTPTDAQASLAVALAHRNLADLARRQQDYTIELDHLRHAAAILDAMDASGQLSGVTERQSLHEEVLRRLTPHAGG